MAVLRLLGFVALMIFRLAAASLIGFPAWLWRLAGWQRYLASRLPEERFRTAVHEAGHALMAWRSPYHDFQGAKLHPRFRIGHAGHCRSRNPGIEEGAPAMRAHAAYCMAGLAAEALFHEGFGAFDGERILMQPDTRLAVLALLLQAGPSADPALLDRMMRAFHRLQSGGAVDDCTDEILAGLQLVDGPLGEAVATLRSERAALLALAGRLLERGSLRPADLRIALGPSARERL